MDLSNSNVPMINNKIKIESNTHQTLEENIDRNDIGEQFEYFIQDTHNKNSIVDQLNEKLEIKGKVVVELYML